MSTKPTTYKVPRTRCPHCDTLCKNVKSRQITETYREITFVCENKKCGCIFLVSMEVVRMIYPSNVPRPGLNIPWPNWGQTPQPTS